MLLELIRKFLLRKEVILSLNLPIACLSKYYLKASMNHNLRFEYCVK